MPAAFTENTAIRLLAMLGETDDTGSLRGPGIGLARGVVLVRCDSATAADASDVDGVGEQCFPGTIVDQGGEDTDQTERSEVWLTILDGEGFATPTAGDVYPCLLSGMVEAAEDDERRRALGASGSAGGGGGAAGDCSAAAGWGASTCLSLIVLSVAGYCAGIDAAQRLLLAWDGGLSKWNSGDDAVDVPEDDFTHDHGIGPARFWFADGRPHATIDGVEGLYLGCDGTGFTFAFGGAALCNGTPAVGACASNVFVVRVACSCCSPTDGFEGPGWYCIEDDSANGKGCVYLADDPCDETVILSGPHADAETCAAACCSIAGWGGAGWYCVFNGTDCEAVELLSDDECDDTITICSGPYANEVLAIAGCGDVCCPDGTTVAFTVAGVANTSAGDTSSCVCTRFNRSWLISLTGGGGTQAGVAGATCDGNTTTVVNLTCGPLQVDLVFYTGTDERARYTVARSSWDCGGDVVMTGGAETVPLCDGWPATITVTTVTP